MDWLRIKCILLIKLYLKFHASYAEAPIGFDQTLFKTYNFVNLGVNKQ